MHSRRSARVAAGSPLIRWILPISVTFTGLPPARQSRAQGGISCCHGFRCFNGRLLASAPDRSGVVMMLIVCPQCAASYRVASQSLGPDGRSVRCAACQTIWFATPAPDGAVLDPATPGSAAALAGGGVAEPEGPGAIGSAPPPTSERADDDIEVRGEDFAAADADMVHGERDIESEISGGDAGPDADEPALLRQAPSIVPLEESVPPPGRRTAGWRSRSPLHAAPLPGEDIESLAARREAERPKHRLWRRLRPRLPSLSTIIVALGGIITILIAARHHIVPLAPQTASFYAALGMPVNLRGLDFENIRVVRDTQDGIPVLIVEGKIVGSGSGIAEVPRLRFAIHDQTGKEIYTWTMLPSRSLLASGESLPFRSRLASPPAEGHDVSIRFFNRRDAISGLR